MCAATDLHGSKTTTTSQPQARMPFRCPMPLRTSPRFCEKFCQQVDLLPIQLQLHSKVRTCLSTSEKRLVNGTCFPRHRRNSSLRSLTKLGRPLKYLIFSLMALIRDPIWGIVKIMVPFWVPLIIRPRIIIGTQKGTIILTIPHMLIFVKGL